MRILVTGGSGFLGINFIRFLLSKGGYEIVSLDIARFDYPERDRIDAVLGDIRDRAAVASAMKGARQVVHAAAALPLYRKEDIYSTDVEGTRRLLEAAVKNGVERFVHVSSTAVYGIPDHHPLHENDRLQGVGAYGRAKILAEAQCLQYRRKGLCVPIVRPKSFIGPERLGVFALLYDWALDGRNFPMIGRGNNRYQLLDVEDLCAAIHLCLTQPARIANDTFNIGAKLFTTMRKEYQSVLDEAGRGKRIVSLPERPTVMALKVMELLRLSPLYKWVYETASTDSFVSIRKAEEKLGYAPLYSNRDALSRNFRWYAENSRRFKGTTGISHRTPWSQGILGVLKLFF